MKLITGITLDKCEPKQLCRLGTVSYNNWEGGGLKTGLTTSQR